jgi:hypothetical protein
LDDTFILAVLTVEVGSTHAFSVDTDTTVLALACTLLYFSVGKHKVSALMDLPCSCCKFKLQCARIAGDILRHPELFGFVAHISSAGERA